MSRLIDADALIMALRLEYPMMPMFKESRKEWEEKTEGYRKAEEIINEAPTIDAVSVVHGEWIDIGWKGDWQFETDGKGNCWYEYECSECGFRNKGSKSNFCPNCGAQMKGADDE